MTDNTEIQKIIYFLKAINPTLTVVQFGTTEEITSRGKVVSVQEVTKQPVPLTWGHILEDLVIIEAVAATSRITVVSQPHAGNGDSDTLTVAGTTYMFVSDTPEEDEIEIGGTINATAAAIAAKLTADKTTLGLTSAIATQNVVAMIVSPSGVAGNSKILTTDGTRITKVAFSGGSDRTSTIMVGYGYDVSFKIHCISFVSYDEADRLADAIERSFKWHSWLFNTTRKKTMLDYDIIGVGDVYRRPALPILEPEVSRVILDIDLRMRRTYAEPITTVDTINLEGEFTD